MLIQTAQIFLSLFAIGTLCSQSAMDAFATLFLVTAVILMIRDRAYRAHLFRKTGYEAMILLWFAMTVLSLILGASKVEVPQWQKLFDFRWFLFAVLIGRHLSYTQTRLRTLSWHLAALSLGSLWAIFLFLWKSNPLSSQPLDLIGDGTVRTGGFLNQPIVFAQLYALWVMLPLGILLFQSPRFSELRKTPVSFALLIDSSFWTLIAILLSFTRGIWLAVPAALFVVLWCRQKAGAFWSFLMGGSVLFVLTRIWPTLNERLLQAFQGGDSERVWIWTANWRMWTESPWFGVGYNHNVQLLPHYYEIIGAPAGLLQSHAHNQYLHILTGIGIAGFLFYMGFWILVMERVRRLARKLPASSVAQGFAFGLYGAFWVFLFGGLFESNFEHAKIRSMLALLLGLLFWLEDLAQGKYAASGKTTEPLEADRLSRLTLLPTGTQKP